MSNLSRAVARGTHCWSSYAAGVMTPFVLAVCVWVIEATRP